ncbi:hypothetical protein BWZ20_14195 [Winogradskyella sp. J14-2]|uniref:hypothetical protein n=1 Tax=Winogradskyella sp. J14-2 TaxID=1936080 RepID=UPI000972B48F|nr:hypothetical protein [Winogradskyella sp. J14-2]APY09385.1 hypothetical protein BWZ20_14195 [Winogradskyella sp. J14-2]
MRLFPINKNSIALIIIAIITIGFFTAGMFEVLEYFIIKALLFSLFGGLLIIAFWHALKNDAKKNSPEDKLQDDSH